MDILARLFGSPLRLKILRLFLFNPSKPFDMEYIRGKTDAPKGSIDREISFLRQLGILKATRLSKVFEVKKGKKTVKKKKKVKAWTLDQKFKFASALTDFLVKTNSLGNKAIVKRIEGAGRIKAIVTAGVFTGDPESRLDLFVVGDNVRSASIDRIVRGLESDLGKDIRYTVLSGPDFSYRTSMNDKLIRDIFDYPHSILLDKLGIAK